MRPMEYIRREVFGISQVAMAAIARVNQATVSRWETGDSEPSRAEMDRIREKARQMGLKWRDSWFFEAAE